METRETRAFLGPQCVKETLWYQLLGLIIQWYPIHSPGSDRSLVMHEDVESVAGSVRDEETEEEEGDSVHDVMNFTQRSRSVSPVRSRAPSISPLV